MAKRAKKTTRKKTSVWAQVWAFCVAAWGFCAKTLPKTLPFLPIIIVLAAAFWFRSFSEAPLITRRFRFRRLMSSAWARFLIS